MSSPFKANREKRFGPYPLWGSSKPYINVGRAIRSGVFKGFVFAMIWGVLVGTYSSIFIAGTALLYLGVKRDWSKSSANKGNQFGDIDA